MITSHRVEFLLLIFILGERLKAKVIGSGCSLRSLGNRLKPFKLIIYNVIFSDLVSRRKSLLFALQLVRWIASSQLYVEDHWFVLRTARLL